MKWRKQLEQQQMIGGGSSGAQQIQQAPTPAVAPPVTESAPEVVQAQQDVLRQELAKKSVRSTVHAGDTGNYTGPGPAAGSGLPPMVPTYRL